MFGFHYNRRFLWLIFKVAYILSTTLWKSLQECINWVPILQSLISFSRYSFDVIDIFRRLQVVFVILNSLKQEEKKLICFFHLKDFFNSISESIALMFMKDNQSG